MCMPSGRCTGGSRLGGALAIGQRPLIRITKPPCWAPTAGGILVFKFLGLNFPSPGVLGLRVITRLNVPTPTVGPVVAPGVVGAAARSSGSPQQQQHPGELLIEQSQLATRGFYWGLAMIPILYIVHGLLVGPSTPPARRLSPDLGKDP